ncbi:MAG: P-loop NTPase [Deltaproteobacteria bacterium]|nr:P-loop NTPase [Deltaproteobacteria bacterium]
MKELVVLSGKGGAGKTTVSAALATHWAWRAVLVDADVDGANLHLVLRPRANRATRFMEGKLPRWVSDRCTGCGVCTQVCRFGAIEGGQVARITCEGCGLCAQKCPQGALQMVERHSGDWFVGRTPCGPLVHARLRPGEGNSGKLVALLKEEARGLAARSGLERILCDGPPGAACAATASLAGAAAVLTVADPSSSGLHDLGRVLDLAQRFAVPAYTAVNRADLAPELSDAVDEECRSQGVPVLAHIPFDPAVLHCVDRGVPVSAQPDAPAARVLAKLAAALDDLMGPSESHNGEARGSRRSASDRPLMAGAPTEES